MMNEPRGTYSRALPQARVVGWPVIPGWAIALAMMPPGWIFIARAHRWHLSPSVVVMCLCWTALVMVGYALSRAAAALLDKAGDDWFAARGSRDELDREKRSLLRAIKEIEFDRDTGKVSAADAQAQITVYRARAIEVIKTLEVGAGLTPRERILAELKARSQVDAKLAKAAKKKKGKPEAAAAAPAPVVETPAVEKQEDAS